MASDQRPDVTTIVVTHQNVEIVRRCLSALKTAASRHSQEIVVVDNASTDGTPQVAAAAAPQAEMVLLPHNVGFARANNIARSRARGRFLALINSDCFPDPGSLDLLLDAIQRRPSAGLVGGSLRYEHGRHQPSAGQLPTLMSELWLALALHRLPLSRALGIGLLFSPALYDRSRRVGWVSGAFCVARHDIGPLPDSAFMYGEDVEWAAQASRNGFESWLEPRARAIHLASTSVKRVHRVGFAEAKRVEAALRWFATSGNRQLAAERGILCLHAILRLVGAGLSLPLRGKSALATMQRFWIMLREAALASRRS